MDKKHGIHLYININNLNSIIKKNEKKNDNLRHAFYQVATFIESLEKFTENFSDDCVAEKFITSRLRFFSYIQKDANGEAQNIHISRIVMRKHKLFVIAIYLLFAGIALPVMVTYFGYKVVKTKKSKMNAKVTDSVKSATQTEDNK
jgi:hypothetical protein